jgi:peptidoglycan/xylan/chitin deacetylase (PgdA/CDA1 family)
MLADHGRFPYRPIAGREDFNWPGGRRLAFYVAVCIEHFSYDEGGLGLSYSPGIPHPNTYNWGWREYGNRVGGFRLLDLLREQDVPPTALVNSACFDHCRELMDAYDAGGAEFVGHGRTNSLAPNGLPEDEERAIVREVYETIRDGTGRPPAGWMSPGANPSRVTEDLLAEEGYRYTLDWPIDDQPVWMDTRGGSLLSVPYPHEVNDVPMVIFHDGSSEEFAQMGIDTLDEMLEQSHHQPLVCGITVHTFIVGQPFRLRQFRRVLEHLNTLRDRVWVTTAGAIADHFAGLQSPPQPGSGWREEDGRGA